MIEQTDNDAASYVAPRRLSLSHILELMLTRGSSQSSTVSLTRNARGVTQVEVTVRTGDSDEVPTVDDAMAKAVALYNALCQRYPHDSTPAAGGDS